MVRKTHEQFISQMNEVNNNIEILTKYEKDSIKVLCRCRICGFEWWSAPSNLLQGKGCKHCHFNKMKIARMKSHEQFVKDLSNINPNIEVIGKYDGAKNNIEVKCLKCKHIWSPIADSLLHGYGCPCCKRSKGEEKIEKYLTNNNINFEPQKKFSNLRNTLPLSYDFYLPEYNILIEYQGQFHDGTTSMVLKEKYFDKQQKNDKLKRDYTDNNGYNLLEIWYYDFDNIERIIDKFIYNLKNPVTTTVI